MDATSRDALIEFIRCEAEERGALWIRDNIQRPHSVTVLAELTDDQVIAVAMQFQS